MKTDKSDAVELDAELSQILDADLNLGDSPVVVGDDDEDLSGKKDFFKQGDTDELTFLDNDDEEEDDDNGGEPDPNRNPNPNDNPLDDLDKALDNLDNDDDGGADDGKNKAGRKGSLIEVGNKLVEKGVIKPFEGMEDLSKYTNDEMVELIESNIKHITSEVAQQAPLEIFSKLDPKIKDIVSYNLKGGKDITAMLKIVTASQEVKELSLDNEADQEKIVREYYNSIGWDAADVESEVNSIKDRNELETKASKFKPILDKREDDKLQAKLDEQEAAEKRAQEFQKQHAAMIFQALNKPTLNDIPLTDRVQYQLFTGMTENKFQDRKGNKTNLLGHTIEELQFGEKPNRELLLEALWLMTNPQEYKAHVAEVIKKSLNADVVKTLKDEESRRTPSSSGTGDGRQGATKRSTIPRGPGRGGFFQNQE